MKRKILTIEDIFQIKGRGLIILPGPLINEFPGPDELLVELIKPDGSIILATLTIMLSFHHPPRKEIRWDCILKDIQEEDVPIGTEVWIEQVDLQPR
jgi:hypothetical protein